jgi:VanZ family protein
VTPTFYAALTVILWGVSDEFHQSFVPGRNASALDVVADTFGFVMAVLLLAVATSRTVRELKQR